MKLPDSLKAQAEAAAEAYAIAFYDKDHTHEIAWAKRVAPKVAEAVLAHLYESAGESFDETAAHDKRYSGACFNGDLFVAGARWQFAQSAVVIQALSRNNLALGEEIAALKANAERDLYTMQSQDTEIERLRAELAEARAIIEAGCYIQ